MRVLDLLRQVYREIGLLETSRRQKDMIIADNAGVKAIRYDKDKVSGGQQGDLADVLLNIEKERERINEQIARQLERVMRHRADVMADTELTEKQKRLVDYFIETGNQTEAAIKAGYSKKNARFIASKTLDLPYVKAFREKRLKEIEDKRIAKAKEGGG